MNNRRQAVDSQDTWCHIPENILEVEIELQAQRNRVTRPRSVKLQRRKQKHRGMVVDTKFKLQGGTE